MPSRPSSLLVFPFEKAITLLHDTLKTVGIDEAYGPSIIIFTIGASLRKRIAPRAPPSPLLPPLLPSLPPSLLLLRSGNAVAHTSRSSRAVLGRQRSSC